MQIKKKILAVDDNPTNIKILKKLLSEEYDLKTATTGEEALEIAQKFIPDLILLDIMMPGLDGYEVCRRLRERSALLDTTIIMVTAKGHLEDKIKGHEVGADDYITKPFDDTDLQDSIKFFLRRSTAMHNCLVFEQDEQGYS